MKRGIKLTAYIFVILIVISTFGLLELSRKVSAILREDVRGYLTLTFDDGYKSNYYTIAPLLKEEGYNGVLFFITGWDGNFDFGRKLMSFEEAKELQEQGWEIGSHTITHRSLSKITLEEAESELNKSKNDLEKQNITVTSFAFPYGDYTPEVSDIASKYYTYSRTVFSGYNDLKSHNKKELKAFMLTSFIQPNVVCEWINYANSRGLWLILTFHYIDNDTSVIWDYKTDNFKQILNCISQSKINVKTFNEMSEIINKKV